MDTNWQSRTVVALGIMVALLVIGGGVVLYASGIPTSIVDTPEQNSTNPNTNPNVPLNVTSADFPGGFGPDDVSTIRAVDTHKQRLSTVSAYTYTYERKVNGTLVEERTLNVSGDNMTGTHLIQTGSEMRTFEIEMQDGVAVRKNVTESDGVRRVVADSYTTGVMTYTTGFEMGTHNVSHVRFSNSGDVKFYIYQLTGESDPRIQSVFYVREDGLIVYGNIRYQTDSGEFISEKVRILPE